MTKFEILTLLANRCNEFATITEAYQDWVQVGLTCANFGELGRPLFHQFSAQSPKYKSEECDKVYNRFLKSSKHIDSIGGVVKLLPFNLDTWLQMQFPKQETNTFSFSCSINPAQKILEREKENISALDKWAEWSAFLPQIVRDLANLGETYEKKMACFFAGLCCLSGCMGESTLTYGGSLTYLQLYYGLCGQAGTGKGCINKVKSYFLPIHRKLREQNESERKEWLKDKNRDVLNAPANYMFFIPSNISSSALIDALQDNKGGGVMFESELDTLLTAFKSDFGNYSTILRANFHNEHISTYRKAYKQLNEIVNSHLSFCCSGTPDQFTKLLKGEGENGLISRFMFSFIEDKSEFSNPFNSTTHSCNTELQNKITQLYNALKQTPIYCTIAESDGDFLVNTMRKIESQLENDTQISITRRLALSWVRLACILSICKALERGTLTQIHQVDSILFRHLENMVNWLFDNALKMQAIATTENNSTNKINIIFSQLSANFSRNDVEVLAKCSDRTARRYISAWQQSGLINKPNKGIYTKIN